MTAKLTTEGRSGNHGIISKWKGIGGSRINQMFIQRWTD
jgi:hypothetical protein